MIAQGLQPQGPAPRAWQRLRAGVQGWAQLLGLGAVLGVLALSPAAWRQAGRGALARHSVAAALPMLAGFSIASALVCLVVIRIVLVTAHSYGLSQLALEMVVRVLVLELIPLAVALAGAVQATLPMAEALRRERKTGAFEAVVASGRDPLAVLVLPRLVAGMFALLLLALASCVLTLVLAYLLAHGFSGGGLASYTRTVGRVFSPAVALVFGVKLLALSLAVAWIPLGTVLQQPLGVRTRASAEMRALVRLLLVALGIEALALVGSYQ